MSLPLADQQWIVVAADEVQEQLARSPLELEPKRVEVFTETDAFDEEAWRLRLYLPRPVGRTWGSRASLDTRRAAVDAFDMFAARTHHALPGRTLALVTTDEAPEADIAEPEGPASREERELAE